MLNNTRILQLNCCKTCTEHKLNCRYKTTGYKITIYEESTYIFYFFDKPVQYESVFRQQRIAHFQLCLGIRAIWGQFNLTNV